MTLRTRLLGLAGMLAAVGPAAGKPPGLPARPGVEGREPNPVVREFYQEEAPPAGYATEPVGPRAGGEPKGRGWGVFAGVIRDTLLDRLTIPLGTVPVWD